MSTRSSTPFGLFKVTEAGLYLRDTTISNATSSRHGLLPKLDGNAAHFLDGTGAWSTPAGSGAAAGMTLLESHAFGGTSSVSFATRNASGQSGDTFQTDFNNYFCVVEELVPSTTSTMTMQVKNTGTPDTTSGHYYTAQLSWSTGGVGAGGPGSGTSILLAPLNGRTFVTTANKNVSGWFTIHNPLGTTHRSLIGEWYTPDSASANPQRLGMTAGYLHTTAFESFNINVSSGTATGNVYIYGLGK